MRGGGGFTTGIPAEEGSPFCLAECGSCGGRGGNLATSSAIISIARSGISGGSEVICVLIYKGRSEGSFGNSIEGGTSLETDFLAWQILCGFGIAV